MKLDALRKPRELKFLLKHLHLHFYSVEFNLASYRHLQMHMHLYDDCLPV